MKWLIMSAFLAYLPATAQVSENYNDGNFTSNPAWFGDGSSFRIENGWLQSASTTEDHKFYLSTPNSLAYAEWTFTVKLDFSTSSLNYVDVFLISHDENLLQPGNTGYFVRIGYTQDEISLYRKDAGGEVKLIDGIDASIAGTSNEVEVHVSRSPGNRFMLFRDIGLSGNFFAEGSMVDSTYNSTSHFGFVVRQGSSSFFRKHFFDDITIGAFIPDTISPEVFRATPSSSTTLIVEYSEVVDPAQALSPLNYSVNGGVGLARGVESDPFDPKIFHLTFFNRFPERQELRLSVTGISDLAGNPIRPGYYPFAFFNPAFGDVLIHEIMADPTPPQLLPDVEWVELRNNSGFTVSLHGWKFCRSSVCITLPAIVLPADSSVAITSATRLPELMPFGRTIGVTSFPSLNNSGDVLSVYSPEQKLIHAVKYSDAWYKDEFRKQGGFSLEMIDPQRFCLGSENWTASRSATGGTPGRINSVAGIVADEILPYPLRVLVTDSMNIEVVFNETVDSVSSARANYTISPVVDVSESKPVSPLFNSVKLQLSAPLQRGVSYSIAVSGVQDCSGLTSAHTVLNFGLPELPAPGDIVVNEILFNPFSGGVDFIELYNNSNKIIAANSLLVANRNEAGELNSLVPIINEPRLILPAGYCVLTEDPQLVKQQYVCGEDESFITLYTPSMPDDEGEVVILNSVGEYIDEVNYTDDWHFPLISNDEGISLERIAYTGSSVDPGNWHSAASTHGFATPGLKNSQSRTLLASAAEINVEPKVISPNSDGRDDFTTINYGLTASGYTANLTIFDAGGHVVRRLCRNELCGAKGFWKWDGLGDEAKVLSTGAYIIFIELLNPAGDRLIFKKVVLLAGETL